MTNTAIVLSKKVEIDKIDITTKMTVIKENMGIHDKINYQKKNKGVRKHRQACEEEGYGRKT